jgi:hypothetical protein
MGDDSTVSPSANDAPPTPAPSTPPGRRGFIRRNWVRFGMLGLILIPFAIFTVWAGITLTFSYSAGRRVGFVQKLSKKGWICKTWEGELQMTPVPGTVPSIFAFSVRDDSVAHAIEAAAGKQVALEYEEHRGVPTRCFGETDYFVVGVRVLGGR